MNARPEMSNDMAAHTDVAMNNAESLAQQCLLPPQHLVQQAGWDRMRLQHLSLDAHLSVLQIAKMLLTTISGKRTQLSKGIVYLYQPLIVSL